jgi:hypothetical protein
MTASSRTWLSLILIGFALPGCRLPGGDSGRQLEGTWRGDVIGVTVFDRFGHAYEVAALDVKSGPQGYASRAGSQPSSYLEYANSLVGEQRGGGRVPLLARGEGVPHVVTAQGAPIGTTVEVRGVMTVYHATAPIDAPDAAWSVYRASPEAIAADKDHVLLEHILVVRGPLRRAQRAE